MFVAHLGLLGWAACGGGKDIVDAQPAADQANNIDLSITPTSADFGAVQLGGTSGPETFTVKHESGETASSLQVQIVTKDALDFRIATDTCTGTSLGPGSECTVEVELSPVCEGPLYSVLRVSAASGWPFVRATLTGEGLPLRP